MTLPARYGACEELVECAPVLIGLLVFVAGDVYGRRSVAAALSKPACTRYSMTMSVISRASASSSLLGAATGAAPPLCAGAALPVPPLLGVGPLRGGGRPIAVMLVSGCRSSLLVVALEWRTYLRLLDSARNKEAFVLNLL